MSMKFIAFLDILGFKDLVENNSAEALADIYKEALLFGYQRSIEGLEELPEFKDPEDEIKSIIISDSILFWSVNDNFNSFIKLIIIIEGFIYASIYKGIPLRGSIEYDELIEVNPTHISKNLSNSTPIILGRSIVKAYSKENKQNWAGCTVANECIERFETLYAESDVEERIGIHTLVEYGYLIKYKVPYKNGAITEEFVINWPKMLDTKPDPEKVRGSFKLHSKKVDDWNVEYLIRNTLDFLEYSWAFKTKHV